MVIVHVIPNAPTNMLLVQRNDMVKEFATTTAYPPFRDAILPRRLHAGPFGFQPGRLQKRDDVSIEFRVAIEDDITIRASFGKGLAQLLDDPIRRWVPRDIEVQDLTTGVFDYEEAVQQFKIDRRNREEVKGNNRFSVILQKRQPTFLRITPPSNAPEIAGDAALGNDKAQFLQLTMDLGCAPIRVVIGQAPDQDANFFGDLRPASAGTGAPTPVEPEAGAVPADDRLGSDDHQDIAPPRPPAPERCPENAVPGVQLWARSLALEHGNLLSKGEDFHGSIGSTAKEDADHCQDGEDEFRHEITVVTCPHAVSVKAPASTQVADSTTPWSFGYEQGKRFRR